MCLYTYICCVGVLNLNSTFVTNTTITVTWDPPVTPSGCGLVFYYVTVTSLADDNDRNTIEWSPGAEFSNLANITNYTISVTAVNRAGSGPSSTIIVATLTDNEGKVIIFNVHNSMCNVYALHCVYICRVHIVDSKYVASMNASP